MINNDYDGRPESILSAHELDRKYPATNDPYENWALNLIGYKRLKPKPACNKYAKLKLFLDLWKEYKESIMNHTIDYAAFRTLDDLAHTVRRQMNDDFK